MLQTVSLLCLKILRIFGQRVMAEAQNRPLEDACSTVINITVWFINFHYVYSFEIIVVCYFSQSSSGIRYGIHFGIRGKKKLEFRL
jgi:hypothetical protein